MTENTLDAKLLEVLRCPCSDHGELAYDVGAAELTCTVCGLAFPVRDGIPVMLIDEARQTRTASEDS